MNLREAKAQMRALYNNGDVSDEVYKLHKTIVKEYESIITERTSNTWSYCDEKLLIHMYEYGHSVDDMCDALHRSTRAIDKRIKYLKKEGIIK